MTEDAKKQLAAARLKSIETRKANAMKKKQEKEQNENKKYIDEIDSLKRQIQELQNKPQEKIVEKVVYKEPEETNYKFNLEDLEFYANEHLKKYKEIEDEVKQKRNRQVRDKYFLNLR